MVAKPAWYAGALAVMKPFFPRGQPSLSEDDGRISLIFDLPDFIADAKTIIALATICKKYDLGFEITQGHNNLLYAEFSSIE